MFFSCEKDSLLEAHQIENEATNVVDANPEAKVIPSGFEFDRTKYLRSHTEEGNSFGQALGSRKYIPIDIIQQVYDFILDQHNENDFLTELVSSLGLPQWIDGTINYADDDNGYVLSIPWKKDGIYTGNLQIVNGLGTYYVRIITLDALDYHMQVGDDENGTAFNKMALIDLAYYLTYYDQSEGYDMDAIRALIGFIEPNSGTRTIDCFVVTFLECKPDPEITFNATGADCVCPANSHCEVVSMEIRCYSDGQHFSTFFGFLPGFDWFSNWESFFKFHFDQFNKTNGDPSSNTNTGPGNEGSNNNDDNLLGLTEQKAVMRSLNNLGIDRLWLNHLLPCVTGSGSNTSIAESCIQTTLLDPFLNENPVIQIKVEDFLNNYGNTVDAQRHVRDQIFLMLWDPGYKELVESSFSWSGVMWSIAKELVGDKAVDIIIQFIPGFGQKDEIRDAIKAAKNGDWIEFTFEVGKIVVNNTPLGKLLKTWEAAHTMYDFYKKVEKLWDKVDGVAENIVEQMWDIVSKYGEKVRLNSHLIGGMVKALNRGLKSIGDVLDAIPNFTKMSSARMKHILHGDTGGGLHHISGFIDDPTKEILEYLGPNTKGVYKVRYKLSNGDVKWSSMFPDSKSEIGVAKSIEKVYNDNIANILTDPFGNDYIEGLDAAGITIRIGLNSNLEVLTAFPIFNN